MRHVLDQLTSGLDEIGLVCSDEQKDLLLKHLELVLKKNKELNLTRIDSLEDGIVLHIIDSLLPAQHLSTFGTGLSVLDIGTGGGFPGIPLGIVLDDSITLIDSINKKIAAVQSFVDALEMNNVCKTLCTRSEDLARSNSESFDVVVARAVASTNVLVEYSAPLLVQGGYLCALKANVSQEEYLQTERAAEVCGMKIVSRETVELPMGYGHREMLYIQKIEEPHIVLPRRNGMAMKRPLGIK